MFAQMRSKNNDTPTHCPCEWTCVCHYPQKEPVALLIIVLLLAIGLIGFGIIMISLHKPKAKLYVFVNDQKCEVIQEVDYCNSTGFCNYKNVAVCPK